MNKTEIFTTVEFIFQDVFNSPSLQLKEETSNNDIDGWTSLTHAVLIDNIEKAFDINFDIQDMLTMHTVGDIVRKIEIHKS